MDDRLRESLSAMLDDEADELAVRRILAHGDYDKVQAQWLRWHRLREQMRGHDQRWSDVDVRGGIWARLEEPAPETEPQTKQMDPGPHKAMRGPRTAALAAMLVMALALGFGAGQRWSDIEPAATLASIDSATAQQQAAGIPSVPLQNLDEEQWEQLSDYLLRHAQHNSVAAGHGAVGFARVASVSPGTP